MDEKIAEDIEANALKVSEVKDFINKLYYDPAFSTLFTRPVLSLLAAACDYLTINLDLLAQKARR